MECDSIPQLYKRERIKVRMSRKAISVFAGFANGAIIDDEGRVNILKEDDPYADPDKFLFPSPVIKVACWMMNLFMEMDV